MFEIKGSVFRYISSGIIVSTYSFIFLSFSNSTNFILILTIVEITSHIIRKFLFEKYVYKSVKNRSKKIKLLKYIQSILPPYLLNVILYISLPLNNSFLNSLRVIIVSGLMGYFSSIYFYLLKK